MWFLLTALAAEPQPQKCCSKPVIEQQLKFYFKVQGQLASGEKAGQITGTFYGWAPKAAKAASALSGPERDAARKIATLTERMKNGKLASIRDDFLELSQLLSYLVVRNPGGNTTFYEAHCDARPWMQADGSTLASPYGDCGTWRIPQK